MKQNTRSTGRYIIFLFLDISFCKDKGENKLEKQYEKYGGNNRETLAAC